MDNTLIGSILSLLFIVVAARSLLKKYNPHAVLLFSGLLMLGISFILNHKMPELKDTSGFTGFDVFKYVKESFSKTNADVGLMIMIIGGFVAYIDKIGASKCLVDVAMKPLKLFKNNPYLAASLVIPIGQVLFIAIPSAAGLALLLMASLFPILTNLGVSKISAASVITASTALGIGPASVITASASSIVDMSPVNMFINHQIFISAILSVSMMVSYFFVNRYYDKKIEVNEEAVETKTEPTNAPTIYAIIPIIPIILLIVFSELFNLFAVPITLDTTTAMIMSLIIALLFELIRTRDIRLVFSSLKVFWDGMGNIFKGVVTLIIAADIFAKGLISLGFINGLLDVSLNLGLNAVGIIIVMTIMIFLASMLMGSGNAAFFAFGPLVPKIATKLGISSTSMIIPMQLSASMGRTVSPVAGVIIAVSEIAGITTLQIVKRNIIPLCVALLLMLGFQFI
jgi:DcuC family C4-dicarboxylate transporter